MMSYIRQTHVWRRSLRQTVLVATLATGVIATGAGADELALASATAQDNPAITVSVSDVNAPGELLRVAVNKAILVQFSVPVNEVRVAKEAIAEVEPVTPYQLLVRGVSFGTTQLIVKLNGDTHKVFDVAVDLELDRLSASIRTAAPRARVKVNSLLDTVVLTGTAPDAESAERIGEIAAIFSEHVINHLRVAGTHQVLLRCTVAEVNRTATRQLGFNGWIAGDNTPSVFGLSNIGGINPSNIGAAGGSIVSPPQALPGTVEASYAGLVPFAIDAAGIPVSTATTLSLGFPQVPMQVFIQALRENGLLRVLAEPNLIAISGQEASFLAGGSFPVPVPQGDNAVTITYRDYGVQLLFTPSVLTEGRIRLHVAPTISEPDMSTAVQFGGFFVPGLIERRVETTVEVGSGQTIAIGGLLSEHVRSVSQKVPGLGDLPVLGALFSSIEYQEDQTELVVLITPELVSGISPQQVAQVPGANMQAPNDFEFFLLGQTTGSGEPGTPKLTPHVNRVRPTQTSGAYESVDVMKLRGPVGPAGSSEGS